jgi:hypothetical protein
VRIQRRATERMSASVKLSRSSAVGSAEGEVGWVLSSRHHMKRAPWRKKPSSSREKATSQTGTAVSGNHSSNG